MLPLWEDVLPNVPDEELRAAAEQVAEPDGVTDRFVAFVDRLARRPGHDADPGRGHGRRRAPVPVPLRAGDHRRSPGSRRHGSAARILLERAAYRMTTTDATLLDIAVEAGYSSHEAFTRAFRREYGVAPSVWRRRPARFRIASPNGVHFHPPGGLRLPARHRMDSMDLVVEMVEHHVWVVDQLVDRAAAADRGAARRPLRRTGRGDRRRVAALGPVPADRADGDVVRGDGRPRVRLRGRAPTSRSRRCGAGWPRPARTFVDAGARGGRRGPVRRDLRRRVRARAGGDDLRRDGRPRADLRRPPPAAWPCSKLRQFGITDLGWGDPKPWFTAAEVG